MSAVLVPVLQLISLVFVARAILSWFPVRPSSPLYPVVRGVDRLTEPILEPIRRFLPPMGGIDLSNLIVIVVINFLLVPLASRL